MKLSRRTFFRLRTYFITGILVLAPTMVSIWVFIKAFNLFDSILGKYYDFYIFEPFSIHRPPGIGALTLAAFIVLIGMSVRFYTGRKLIDIWDKIINKVPLINRVYIAVRQLSNSISKGSGILFQKVVFIEYPRPGLYSVGFVANQQVNSLSDQTNNRLLNVFVPTTPNPTTGFFVLVSPEETYPLDMSIEEGMKLIISAGTVVP
jgi:uncharacterized membrane protein